MKKIAVIILLLAVCSLVFACKNRTELTVYDRLSYFERSFFIGDTGEFLIIVKYGIREVFPLSDGIIGEREEFCAIELKRLKLSSKTPTYEFYGKKGGFAEKDGVLVDVIAEKLPEGGEIVLITDEKSERVELLAVEKDADYEGIVNNALFSGDAMRLKKLGKYEINLSYVTDGFELYRYLAFIGKKDRYDLLIDFKSGKTVAE